MILELSLGEVSLEGLGIDVDGHVKLSLLARYEVLLENLAPIYFRFAPDTVSFLFSLNLGRGQNFASLSVRFIWTYLVWLQTEV